MYKAVSGYKPWQEVTRKLRKNERTGRKTHDKKLYRSGYKTKQGSQSTLGRGIVEWNNLPPTILYDPLPSLKEFKFRLKNITQLEPFEGIK